MTEREYQRNVQRLVQKIFVSAEGKSRSRAEMLRLSKQFLRLKETRIRMRHRAGLEGAEVCRMRSDVINALVRLLWDYLLQPSKTKSCARTCRSPCAPTEATDAE